MKQLNEKPILFGEMSVGGYTIGTVDLNRAYALNALNTECYVLLESRLKEWLHDSKIAAVFIGSTSDKAFCAGGDVKSLAQMSRNDLGIAKTFFTNEYFMDYFIHNYPKPIVAFASGITMGGGVGLIQGCAFRVVTETTVMAMPEVAIGLFPDVGATQFLSRVPHHFGLFMGLTGARISGAEAIATGLADYFMPQSTIVKLKNEILHLPWNDSSSQNHELLKSYFKRVTQPSPAPNLLNDYLTEARPMMESLIGDIESGFKQFRLANFNSNFLKSAQTMFIAGSPLAQLMFYMAYKRHKDIPLSEVFVNEWEMAIRSMKEDEFYEGVRAVLIDKDHKPKWSHKLLSQIKEDSNYFFSSQEPNLLAQKVAQDETLASLR